MTTDVRESLAEVATSARADFEHSDPADLTVPVMRYVRRYRATRFAASALGVVLVVSGALLGADALTSVRESAIEPDEPVATPVGMSEDEATTPWSTLALAAVTEPRAYGEKRIDSAAGMICHHSDPADDPRVAIENQSDPLGSELVVTAQCAPVWFKNGPITSDRNATSAITQTPASVSSATVIGNLSDRPLAIDGESIFMWIELAPGDFAADAPTAYPHALVGGSMWDEQGNISALLGSDSHPTRIIPGQYLVASGLATELDGRGPLDDLVASGANFTVTFWARIHEDSPHNGSSYLVRLGEEHIYGGLRS